MTDQNGNSKYLAAVLGVMCGGAMLLWGWTLKELVGVKVELAELRTRILQLAKP